MLNVFNFLASIFFMLFVQLLDIKHALDSLTQCCLINTDLMSNS